MADHKIGSKVLLFIATAILCVVVAMFSYMFVKTMDSGKWVEKDELFGLKLGMTKHEVIKGLKHIGVRDVLPRLIKDIAVNHTDISKVKYLRGVPGVCITNTSKGINMTIAFDSNGDVTKAQYSSIRKFDNFSGFYTFDEFVSQLSPMLLRDQGITAHACIPDNDWIRISGINDEGLNNLEQYDLWLFDQPSSYSRVRLRFSGNQLSAIEYRKQSGELP